MDSPVTSVVGDENPEGYDAKKPGELSLELQDGLRKIVYDFEKEHYSSWRYYNQKFAQADFFWKGVQNIFWDYTTDSWREPSRQDLASVGYEQETIYHYPVNFYEAMGESIIAILGQRRPTIRFVPDNFQKQNDVSSAKARNDVKSYIDRVNKVQLLNAKVLYNAYNHGIWGAHTRWKIDKEYGTHEEPKIESLKREMPAHYYCPDCGARTPETSVITGQDSCEQCGAPLQEQNYIQQQEVDVPTVTEVNEVPNGEVITTIYDGLEMRLPYYCQERKDCPFIGVVHEVHESALQEANPDKANNIRGGYMSSTGSGDDTDRTYRLARMEPSSYYYTFTTTASTSLVTWRRYWLRPHTYRMAGDEIKNKLHEMFPNGVRVEFANDTFLKAFDESMDDHWAIGRAKPGVGMYTNSIGASALPMQQSYNFDEAIKREYIEYKSFEPEFVDSRIIDFRALNRKKIRAREMVPVNIPGNKSIRDVIYEKHGGRGPEAAFRHAPDMFDMARFVVGAPATLTGGTEQSLKPTTFTADRDLALGRKGIHWIQLHHFWADVTQQQVDIYAEHAEEDLSFMAGGAGGDLQGVSVKISDLKNGKAKVYPEVDEQFPMLIEQQRETLNTLMQRPDEMIGEILGHPRNLEYMKSIMGMNRLYIPGEQDRVKQYKEIQQLVQGEPVQQEPGEGEEMAGAVEPVMLPSIMPELDVDNHTIHAEECRNFLVGPEGMRLKESNPAGYANVVLHLSVHEQMAAEKRMQAAMMGVETSEQEAPGTE